MPAKGHATRHDNEDILAPLSPQHSDPDSRGHSTERQCTTEDTISPLPDNHNVSFESVAQEKVFYRGVPRVASSGNAGTLAGEAPQLIEMQARDSSTTTASNSGRSVVLPPLSIDTRKTRSESSAAAGRSRSPLSASEHAQSNSTKSVLPKTSPPSSLASRRTRQRGFSLRRSLLARNAQGQSEHAYPTLSTAPSPLGPRRLSQATVDTGFSKRGNPSVSVSPAGHGEPVALPTSSIKGTSTASSLPRYETWARSRAGHARLGKRIKALYENFRRLLLRIHEIPPSKNGRHILVDLARRKDLVDERTGREYVDNTICSSRYTLWNFLPRQLFAQFSKLANFYFLSVSILQMIPGLSTTGNYTTIVPLTFFVAISMAKEGYDDLRRYKLDKADNTKEAYIARSVPHDEASLATPRRSVDWVKTKWKDVRVGDVVRLQRDEASPADLALLHVQGPNGIAYFETMALDGETNLKSKRAPPPLAKDCKSADELTACNARLVVEDPNLDLYNFDGKVTAGDETFPLTNNDIVYRGSVLRNTPESIGMVVYSGEECKIRMNATKNPRIKAPALQSTVNKVVVVIVIFVTALAMFNTVAYQIWIKTTEKPAWYLTDARVAFFPILSSFIILFNTMVPLSLYVSLEIVKAFQVLLMNDLEMYDEDSNTPMEARTNTINEELGQVKYCTPFAEFDIALANSLQLHLLRQDRHIDEQYNAVSQAEHSRHSLVA